MSEAVGTNKGGLLLGLVIGGAVGAITSLLLAPKAGSELREDLSNTYRTFNDKTSQLASAVGQKTQDIISTVSDKTQDIASVVSEKTQEAASAVSEKTKDIANTVSHQASEAVDKAKESKQLVAESLQAVKSNYQNNQH
ncbi:YtxH domain-containing protein [Paenibacillus alginolyticus]|uniref:YtxH domain-containing protein n=1 Tax=Paenibacillus alginolyticus TaxID=59839 RepID=A0ABT4GIN5_9BACL|nr:YtxH domain-containing protein [Paenibacillus alginolyticus]MCY9696075.1 YtxH domain-containing protein [Paenibacillus alginolyticus]MEC0147477.1 YtxH domain-containing protein [Paenibacillus alginolyticus]